MFRPLLQLAVAPSLALSSGFPVPCKAGFSGSPLAACMTAASQGSGSLPQSGSVAGQHWPPVAISTQLWPWTGPQAEAEVAPGSQGGVQAKVRLPRGRWPCQSSSLSSEDYWSHGGPRKQARDSACASSWVISSFLHVRSCEEVLILASTSAQQGHSHTIW